MLFNLLSAGPSLFVAFVFSLVIAITVHEFAHALAGYLQGDMTARDAGRLTLNPLSHLDPIGSLMLLFAGFGWGKPTPYNPYHLRDPKWGPVYVALAGPLANLIVIIIGVVALRFMGDTLGPANMLPVMLAIMVSINLMLMVFNLLPIPPLDGSQVLFTLLPERFASFKLRFAQNGPFILIGLLILDSAANLNLFGSVYSFFMRFLTLLIGG